MTVDDLKTIGLPLVSSELDVLYVESALQWIVDNTTLEFDPTDTDQLKALPAGAKLFILKYRELFNQPIGVTSESVDGLSQSFSESYKKNKLFEYANELLGGYLKSDVTFVPAHRRWDSKCR